jgi:hypothetical protein
MVWTLDHDSCNPVQIALTEDAIPRAVEVCVRARANGVSRSASQRRKWQILHCGGATAGG